MSLKVVGYVGGRRIVEDEGPQTGRPTQHTYGTRAVVGGSLDYARPGPVDVQRHASLIANRRLRAACRELGIRGRA